ncbi:MurR/RpiR family transcriptional regulator [Priestia megaterium]|nr:MurR/RpiR family transcriptional regulator [Priestia megaterium]
MNSHHFEQVVKEKFQTLSAGQKKVAEYLINHLEEAAFQTAVQIGRESGVSETTVIRLAYSLGFQSFSQMEESIQQRIMVSSSVQNEKNDQDPLERVLSNEVKILKQLTQPSNVENIWKAVDVLVAADQVVIAGYRSSYGAAHWFSLMLTTLRENVRLISQPGEFHEVLCDLTPNSAVVVLSFPRYVEEAIDIARYAEQYNVSVIAVTDRLLSPVSELADVTLITETNVESGFNSIAPIISLLDLVLTGFQVRDPERVQKRQQKLEQLYSYHQTYME